MELIVARSADEVRVEVRAEANGHWTVAVDDREYRVDAATLGRPDVLSLIVDGRQATQSVRSLGNGAYDVDGVELKVIDPRSRTLGEATQQGAANTFEATAYMPGRVVAVLAAEGDEVTSGQGVVVLEAMKMENEIQSEIDGRLERLLVEVGQTVDGGQPLFTVAASAASARAPSTRPGSPG
ncbi:MAG: biotin/lipoyl-binding protein [Acidobacteriota bacterium]|nr:biotin/lipoyl-binding protein [Acidobacteriota bacterium]